MVDSSLWVAGLTAGTAIAASWVTSRGGLRAVREQASASALERRSSWRAQTRRGSYIEVINRAHDMGELYRELPPVLAMPSGPAKESAVADAAKQLRKSYGPFTRACDVMVVDGGNSVAHAVQEVFKHSRAIYMCLLSAPTTPDAATVYTLEIDLYWKSVDALVWAMHREANRHEQ